MHPPVRLHVTIPPSHILIVSFPVIRGAVLLSVGIHTVTNTSQLVVLSH